MFKSMLYTFSIKNPKTVILLTLIMTAVMAFQIPNIVVDTDPENMLNEHEPVRLAHEEMKETFDLSDMLVLGVYKEDGIFNNKSIERIISITEDIKELEGVLEDDVMSVSEVDDIINEDGTIRVYPLADEFPTSDDHAQRMFERIKANPILNNKLAANDGTLVGVYVPMESKTYGYKLKLEIEELAKKYFVDEEYYIAGLPIAEDTFGVSMFQQMGVVAPMAGLVVFLIMVFFLRRIRLIIAPMILAVISVIWTMGLLIGFGFKVHIMSSMIPIFLFPIAVLNSLHIISDFLERYHKSKDVKNSLSKSLDELFFPMLFTSLTTITGFGTLAMTPIPPVQIFGSFVAFGVFSAWLLSMTFLPAFTMLLPESSFKGEAKANNIGMKAIESLLQVVKKFSLNYSKGILASVVVILGISAYGITKIVANDNPVNWFKPGHELRVADKLMNEHMGGTYMSNLVLKGEPDVFKSPDVINYMAAIQSRMLDNQKVGAVTSVVDILEKIGIEMIGNGSVPKTSDEIAQYFFIYEMAGGNPDDLFKFVTSDYDQAQMWIQMTDGDNILMREFVADINGYIAANPVPEGVEIEWAGLNYINIVWQDKMVNGMMNSLLSGFAAVFVIMVFLFRSVLSAFLSMIPLSVTITFIYGLVGFTGKPYDMPIAVLSSLTLGLSVDFAIHYIKRSKDIHKKTNDYKKTLDLTFGEPATAITLNMLVIAIGFVPLFGSNLIPYITVGVFFFMIMLSSGIATLVILPALMNLLKNYIYKPAIQTNEKSVLETKLT